MTQDHHNRPVEQAAERSTKQESEGFTEQWSERCIVIVGMTGVGKSTIGAHLARQLARRFVDLDHYIVEKTGKTIPQIFAEKGESVFRLLEARALEECLALGSDVVVSTGGGAIVTPSNRQLLQGTPLVVWLRADLEDLIGRVSHDTSRPLLVDDPQAALERLSQERGPWYSQVADLSIVTADKAIPEIVDSLVTRITADSPLSTDGGEYSAGEGPSQDSLGGSATMIIERVQLDRGRSYPVIVGPGARHELAGLIPDDVRKVAIVTQQGIDVAVDPGVDHQVFMVEDGERAKRLTVVEDLARAFAQWGMTRHDAVVAVGGGVVTDLGGFVAATYHRGIKVIHVSTSLLGQIDASIGGKCGVNLVEGKNLVGAFWQPTAVICDTEVLSSLPSREFRSGLGELAKYHFLGGGDLQLLDLPKRVAACVRIKADVVAADEREGGKRAILNYGHTLGHALETASVTGSDGAYAIRHGEAVAIGLIYAAEVAFALGRIDEARLAEHRRVVHGYELETQLPPDSDHHELVQLFKRDKKAVHGITFVLDGPLGVEPVVVNDEDLLLECLSKMEHDRI